MSPPIPLMECSDACALMQQCTTMKMSRLSEVHPSSHCRRPSNIDSGTSAWNLQLSPLQKEEKAGDMLSTAGEDATAGEAMVMVPSTAAAATAGLLARRRARAPRALMPAAAVCAGPGKFICEGLANDPLRVAHFWAIKSAPLPCAHQKRAHWR